MIRAAILSLLVLTSSCGVDDSRGTRYLLLPDGYCVEGAAIFGGDQPGEMKKYAEPTKKQVHTFDVYFKADKYVPIDTESGHDVIKRILIFVDYADKDALSPRAKWPAFVDLFNDTIEDGRIKAEGCVRLPRKRAGIPYMDTCTADVHKSGNLVYTVATTENEENHLVLAERVQPNVYLYGVYPMDIPYLDRALATSIMEKIKQAMSLTNNCADL